MEKQTDEKLVASLQKEYNEEIFGHLVRRYMPLFKKSLRLASPWSEYELDDFFQEGQIAMHEAVMTYNPQKSEFFSGYFRTVYDNHMANLYRKDSALKRGGGIQEISIYYKNSQSQDEQNLLDTFDLGRVMPTDQIFEIREVNYEFFSVLSKLELEVIICNLLGMPKEDVAKKLKLKESQIQSAYERSRNKMRKLLGLI